MMTKKVLFSIIAIFILTIIVVFSFNYKRVLYAPSIESIKKVIKLNQNEFIVAGNTKSFTETGDDWIFMKVNSNLDLFRLSVLSGYFGDKLVDVNVFGDYILAVGNTWSFRKESLDDILVSYFDKDLNLMGYYVISGTRDDFVSKLVFLSGDPYIIGYTRSVGFGATSALICKLDKNFSPSTFWVIGSSVDQELFDIIELSQNKFLLVSNYRKMQGNMDCLVSVVDNNFNILRAFAFGGGFDENIVDIKRTNDNFYFIFETRSFKPQDKVNLMISSFKRSNLNHVRSFSFGTLENERYLSSYMYEDKIFVFFSTIVDKLPVIAVAIMDMNLGLKGVYKLNEFLNIDSQVQSFYKMENNLWAVNLFNVNTLEDISIYKTNDIFNSLSRVNSKNSGLNLENLNVQKYYMKVAKYPNIESYPVVLKSQKIDPENFVVTNEIKINYLDIDYQDIWR